MAADESSAMRRRNGAHRDTTETGVVVDTPIRESTIPSLCHRVSEALAATETRRVDCDVAAVVESDVGAVEAFARMQLAARRLGGNVRFQRVSEDMQGLLALIGLDEVLLADFDETGDPRGEAEEREQRCGVEERVDLADPPV